jgi:hypothetical protein
LQAVVALARAAATAKQDHRDRDAGAGSSGSSTRGSGARLRQLIALRSEWGSASSRRCVRESHLAVTDRGDVERAASDPARSSSARARPGRKHSKTHANLAENRLWGFFDEASLARRNLSIQRHGEGALWPDRLLLRESTRHVVISTSSAGCWPSSAPWSLATSIAR